MRVALLLALVACQEGSGSNAASGSSAIAAQPGPYVVAYNCFHKDDTGSQVFNRTYDLGARTLTTVKYELAGNSADAKMTKPPVTAKIDDARAAAISAAVGKVLAGGHFEPEYPVPEGTRASSSSRPTARSCLPSTRPIRNKPMRCRPWSKRCN